MPGTSVSFSGALNIDNIIRSNIGRLLYIISHSWLPSFMQIVIFIFPQCFGTSSPPMDGCYIYWHFFLTLRNNLLKTNKTVKVQLLPYIYGYTNLRGSDITGFLFVSLLQFVKKTLFIHERTIQKPHSHPVSQFHHWNRSRFEAGNH